MEKCIESIHGFYSFSIFSTKWQDFLLDLCVFIGFENVGSMIELGWSWLVSLDIKHCTQNSPLQVRIFI